MLTININGLTLCHKGSDGISHNTLPDVCKTPPFGVPIPYENEAYSADLIKGTISVFADGGNMIANVGSQFARSVFDEPGCMGGVISGTNRAEAEWISHSFDVFFEKKPACRLTDKMFMNHHNTVNMAGLKQDELGEELWDAICTAICECKDSLTPSAAEVNLSLEKMVNDLLGIDRSEAINSEYYKFNEYHNRQHCFATKFNEEPYVEFIGGRPIDPSRLTEVPYEIGPPGKLIRSETGRTTSAGAVAPAGKQRALSKARELGPGKVVIWDMVVVQDKTKPAELENVKHIIEIKFNGDSYTANQLKAKDIPEVAEKFVCIEEYKCNCQSGEEEENNSTENVIIMLLLLLLTRGRGKIVPRPRPGPIPQPLPAG